MFRFKNFIVIRLFVNVSRMNKNVKLLKTFVVEIAISESTGLSGKACLDTAANRSHYNIELN